MTTTQPQDAPAADTTPQDAPHGRFRPAAAGSPTQDNPLEAGWYPSPDGSPTLSWWTGKGWSRTQQPIPAEGTTPPTLTGPVVGPGRTPTPARTLRRRRDRRKGYVPAVLLTAFLGPFGLIWVKWQLAVAYFVAAGLLSAMLDDQWGNSTWLWSRPISVVLAVLAVAWHNHGWTAMAPEVHERGLARGLGASPGIPVGGA